MPISWLHCCHQRAVFLLEVPGNIALHSPNLHHPPSYKQVPPHSKAFAETIPGCCSGDPVTWIQNSRRYIPYSYALRSRRAGVASVHRWKHSVLAVVAVLTNCLHLGICHPPCSRPFLRIADAFQRQSVRQRVPDIVCISYALSFYLVVSLLQEERIYKPVWIPPGQLQGYRWHKKSSLRPIPFSLWWWSWYFVLGKRSRWSKVSSANY